MANPTATRTPSGPAALRILTPPQQSPQTLARLRPAAIAASATLLAVAAIHVAWGAGSTWPYHDGPTLARNVLGISDALGAPPPAATFAVTGALATAASAALMRTSPNPRIRAAARLVTLPAAAVLALRGVGGFAQSLLTPEAATAEFTRNDLRIYSPLCLALAAGLAVLEKPSKPQESPPSRTR